MARKWMLSLLLAGVPTLGAAGTCPFGMCSNGQFLTNPEYPARLAEAGARWVRLDASFATVRAKPGDDPDQRDWGVFERIKAVRAAHPEIRVLCILGYGAEWAADARFDAVPGPKLASPPRGADVQPAWSPGNLYGHYVYEAVRRYHDVVDAWESWNEPDLPGHAFFRGNGADFLPYQRACYLAAKHAAPDCTVLFAGLCFASVEGYLSAHGLHAPSPSPPSESFFEDYLRACQADPAAKGERYYFDVANQHSYSRASDLYDYVAIAQRAMTDILSASKPVWVTEMGAQDKEGSFGLSPDSYCDYLLQSYAWGALAGVERYFHFQLDNSNGHGLYDGMLGQPKPALITYRDVLTREFAQARFVAQRHGSRGVDFLAGHSAFKPVWKTGYNLFEFARADGKRLSVAWADTDQRQTITIPARGAQAVLIDRHNQRTTVKPRAGAYELTLEGATQPGGWPTINDAGKALGEPEYLVGGATLVVVE